MKIKYKCKSVEHRGGYNSLQSISKCPFGIRDIASNGNVIMVGSFGCQKCKSFRGRIPLRGMIICSKGWIEWIKTYIKRLQ